MTSTTYAAILTGNYTVESGLITVNGRLIGPRSNPVSVFPFINTPSAPIVSNITQCQYQTPNSLTGTGQNLKWYTVLTGGQAYTSITSGTGWPWTEDFYVTQTVNGCESMRVKQSVTTISAPASPTVANSTYCLNDVATPFTAIGQNIRWYTTVTGGQAYSSITPYTTWPQTLDFYVTQTVNGCESSRVKQSFTVNPIPVAPSALSITYNQNQPVNPLTATGQNLRWYLTAVSSQSYASVTPITSVTGNQYYYVSQTVSGCESLRATVLVSITEPVSGCPAMYTIKAGLWNDATVWSCGRVLVSSDVVTVAHNITIPFNTSA